MCWVLWFWVLFNIFVGLVFGLLLILVGVCFSCVDGVFEIVVLCR